jgi:hypothetical protein
MEIKNHCLILGFSLSLTVLTSACGHAGPESNSLPNQRVPVETTAPQAVASPPAITEKPAAIVLSDDRVLLPTAIHLVSLSDAEYLSLQEKWVGSEEAACNYFVITALCESGYCKSDKPFYKAADFGTYFQDTGWAEITLAEAKVYLKNKSQLDMVAQRGPLSGETMGHIAVPYEVNADEELVVAQGNYDESTHEMQHWGDSFASPFHYYVNLAPTEASHEN